MDADSAAARGLRAGYERVRSRLLASSTVPLRLPLIVAGGRTDDSLYVVVADVDSASYYVVFGSTPYCAGGPACRYGSALGERITRSTSPMSGQRVAIRPGVVGRYARGECAAGCSDSELTWTERPYRYTVGIKRGSLADVLRMARSIRGDGAE